MKFKSPHIYKPNFIDLGVFDYTDVNKVLHQYDLYILVGDKEHLIHLGARYGNAPEDYLSGSADYYKGNWHFIGSLPLMVAAARYFANHHYNRRQT